MDIDKMSNRELVRGLMRGDKTTFKQGYTAEASVEAVHRLRKLDVGERHALLRYAEGFSDGLLDEAVESSTASLGTNRQTV